MSKKYCARISVRAVLDKLATLMKDDLGMRVYLPTIDWDGDILIICATRKARANQIARLRAAMLAVGLVPTILGIKEYEVDQ